MVPLSDDRFDEELAGWFSLRGGAWSGTAAELLASVGSRSDGSSSVWPRSPRGLYDHLKSRSQRLQSLGVAVLLRDGVPRMVSLRPCPNEPPSKRPTPEPLDVERAPDPAVTLLSSVGVQNAGAADASHDASHDATHDASHAAPSVGKPVLGERPTAESAPAGPSPGGKYFAGDKFEACVFENTAEALVAIGEMRQRIREQALDLESAAQLVISRAHDITRSCGIAVGFLTPEGWRQPAWKGSEVSPKVAHFDANLFQSSLITGQAVQLRDAQKHPFLGTRCQQECIGSLMIVPIFRNSDVAGAMEFFFREKRFFSAGEVMDLSLIAGVIGERLGDAAQSGEATGATQGFDPEAKAAKIVDRQPALPRLEKEGRGNHLPTAAEPILRPETAAAESIAVSSLASAKLATALLWRAFRRAWIRQPHRM
jgi:hypothetical protein